MTHLGFGESAIALAVPDQIAVVGDLEDAAGAGLQDHFTQVGRKRGQEFLRHPTGAQQPLALRAVQDDDTGTKGGGVHGNYSTVPALRGPGFGRAAHSWIMSGFPGRAMRPEPAMKSAASSRSQRWLIGLLMGLVTLTPMGIDIYLPSLPAMADGFGQPVSALQASITLFIFAVGVGQMLIGPLADRYGRRPVALGGALAYLAGSALGAAATSLEVFYAARIIQGLAT
ncbi:hypothetical protein G6F65_019218 [Rhizopus arrhizus]|nr:hypothetical protein G6F65_019218 [Rhizopus arrhizus]